MGVTIHGIKPFKLIADGKELVQPSEKEDKKEQDVYLKAKNNDKAKELPGQYFNATFFQWRPIHILCGVVNEGLTIKLPSMQKWGDNNGAGFKSQGQCDILAEGLDLIIDKFEKWGSGKIYLDVSGFVDGGMYIKYKGVDKTALAIKSAEFLTEEDMEKYKDGIKFIQKQGICVRTPYVIEDPKDEYVLIEPAHSVYLPHIREFVRFLRNCGGFEIW